jgi:hypothetical protein
VTLAPRGLRHLAAPGKVTQCTVDRSSSPKGDSKPFTRAAILPNRARRTRRQFAGTTHGFARRLFRAVRDRTVEVRECPDAGTAEPPQCLHGRRINDRPRTTPGHETRFPPPNCLQDWGGLQGTAGDFMGRTWQQIARRDPSDHRKSSAITS